MNVASKLKNGNDDKWIQKIEFNIRIYESKKWKDMYLDNNQDDVKRVLCVRLERKSGDMSTWMKIKREFLLMYCYTILKGLPTLKNMDENNFDDEYEFEDNDEDVDDKDYRDILLDSL